jgi:hypothetical protein
MKPRLTAGVVSDLLALAGYGEAGAEDMGETESEREHKEEIRRAVEWIRKLCNWYETEK